MSQSVSSGSGNIRPPTPTTTSSGSNSTSAGSNSTSTGSNSTSTGPNSTSSGSNSSSDVSVPPKKVTITISDKTRTRIFRTIYVILWVLLTPITLPIAFVNFWYQQTKNITLLILGELNKVAKLAYNLLDLVILMLKALNIIIFKDGNTQTLMPRMMEVYNLMAKTLTEFNMLPCTKESAALGHLMLSRLPNSIWEKLLPYPHPFFRGSVTQASKTNSYKLITSMQPVPDDQYCPSPVVVKKNETKPIKAN